MKTNAPRRRPVLPLIACIFALSAIAIGLIAASEELRVVLAPLLAIVSLGVVYLTVIYRRDRQVPVFEVASLWLAAASLYGAYPLLNFIAGGMSWHMYSDSRMLALDAGAKDIAPIGWRYVVWIGAFVVTYLIARGRAAVKTRALAHPGHARVAAVVITFLCVLLFLTGISLAFGVEYSPRYRDALTGDAKSFVSLPLPLLRVVHNVVGMRLVLAWTVVTLLMWKWREPFARLLLISSMSVLAVYTLMRGGARSDLFLLLLVIGILYHRLVRPFTLKATIVGAVMFLAAFNFVGILRLAIVTETSLSTYNVPMFTEANEFQAVMGTTLHLKTMRENRELRDVPTQLHFTEFVLLIPAPLLPFTKINPGQWYIDLIGLTGSSSGYMFGAVSQAVLGWDWIELAIRGMILGLFCAYVHRWYAKNPTSFWRTVFYMYLSIWMYYSVRQASFSFLYFLLYRFLPTMLTIEAVRFLIASFTRRSVKRELAATPLPYGSRTA